MPTSESDRLRRLWTWLVLATVPLSFSSNLVIGRVAINAAEPATLAFWRWLLAAAIMVPVAQHSLRTYAASLARLSPLLLLLGALGMGVCGAGVYLSLRHTTATNAILIYTTSPAFIVLIEMMIGRRPPSLLQFAGIGVASFGVAIIVAKGSLTSLVTLGFNIGDLGILAAAVAWAVYSILLRDPRIQALPDTAVFATVAGFGALANAPFWLIEGVHHGFVPATRAAWISIAALALIPSVAAFLGYQWGVRHVGAARAGMVLYFLPIAGVALATIFLGEAIHAYHVVGTLCTIGGVLLATLPDRLRRRRP